MELQQNNGTAWNESKRDIFAFAGVFSRQGVNRTSSGQNGIINPQIQVGLYAQKAALFGKKQKKKGTARKILEEYEPEVLPPNRSSGNDIFTKYAETSENTLKQ